MNNHGKIVADQSTPYNIIKKKPSVTPEQKNTITNSLLITMKHSSVPRARTMFWCS